MYKNKISHFICLHSKEDHRKLLKEDLTNLIKKYHQLNSPSTFAECAKVQREIVKKKKELADFEGT
jgi:hypothetical protein